MKPSVENCIVDKDINDFLSQSYSQGIERITGTKDHFFNFRVPKELLEVREKTWDNFFDKYSEEMSDEIEINVDTLEPVEEENSEEDNSCGQRIPMRKPATLVQYWINTGNPPCKALLDKNEQSEIGSSLSEKEINSSLNSLFPNEIDKDCRQQCKSNSSCSSVDTAAYILSTANITKKADTVAIIEGAKHNDIKSSTNISTKDIEIVCDDKSIKYVDSAKIDDNSNVNIDISNAVLCSTSMKDAPLMRTDGPLNNDIVISANTVQPNVSSHSSNRDEIDKVDTVSTSQRSLDVRNIGDIVSIFRQFDKTTKRLSGHCKNKDALEQNEMLENHSSDGEQVSTNITENIIAKDMSLTSSHRKKLYTGRNSPVDLILIKRCGTNKLSGTKLNLHPALDSDNTIKRKTSLVYKNKNKHSFLSNTKKQSFKKQIEKKLKKRKQSSVFSKDITNNNDETEIPNNNKTQDCTIENSYKNFPDSHNNLNGLENIASNSDEREVTNSNKIQDCITDSTYKSFSDSHNNLNGLENIVSNSDEREVTNSNKIQDCITDSTYKSFSDSHNNLNRVENDISIGEHNDTDISAKSKTHRQKRDLTLLNLNPVVRLERIIPSFKQYESESRKNDDSMQRNDICNNKNLSMSKKLYTCEIENLGLESVTESDGSTIFMYKCKNMSEDLSYSSDCSFELRLSTECDDFSASNAGKDYNKLLKNITTEKPHVALERLPESVIKDYTNAMKAQALNVNDTLSIYHHEKISNKFKTHSNSHETNETSNIKFRELKIILERIPVNAYFKRSNPSSINIPIDEKEISPNTSEYNNKRRSRIISEIPAHSNAETSRTIHKSSSDYLLRAHTRSKKENNKINDVGSNGLKNGSKIFDEDEGLDSISQYNNHDSQIDRDKHNKHSIFTFISSDEEFVQTLIQPSKKRSKVSIDDKTLNETNRKQKDLYDEKLVNANKDKYRYNRCLSTVTHPSKKAKQKEIDKSIGEKKERGEFEMKFASLKINKNKQFSFFQCESDNSNSDNSFAEDLDKRKRKFSFFNRNKNTSNNSKKRSVIAIKKNKQEMTKEDDTCAILFQTKTFDTDSSDSEESNCITSTRKTLRNSSVHRRSRYRNRISKEEFFNNSIKKRHIKKQPRPLDFSVEEHDVMNRVRNMKNRTRSITDKEAEVNERFNENINLSTTNTKNVVCSVVVSNIGDKLEHKKKALSLNTFLEKDHLDTSNNITENKRIFEKTRVNNSSATKERDVKSTAVKLLTFQTKSYYDSDTSESL